MNPTNRKIILEHVQVAKTACCRMRSFHRSDDEGYERLRALDQCISSVESFFFNQPDDPPDKHPLVWAIENMIEAGTDLNKLKEIYHGT
jgi:hypothetical protein